MKNISKVLVVIFVMGAQGTFKAVAPLEQAKAQLQKKSVFSSNSSSENPASANQSATPNNTPVTPKADLKAKVYHAYEVVAEKVKVAYGYTKEQGGKAVTWVMDHKLVTVGTIAAVSAVAYLVHQYKKKKAQQAQVSDFRTACGDYVNFKTGPAVDPQFIIDSTNLLIAKNVAFTAEPFAQDEAAKAALNTILQANDVSAETMAQVDDAAVYIIENVAPAA